MPRHPQHTASYDDDGNIILPGSTSTPSRPAPKLKLGKAHRKSEPHAHVHSLHPSWMLIDEAEPDLSAAGPPPLERILESAVHVRARLRSLSDATSAAFRESKRQYGTSAKETSFAFRSMLSNWRNARSKTWNFLTQPVWVPGRRKTVKQYRRGTLFVIDIFRFGGTFAAMFFLLFAAMNYQSFWDITRARIPKLLTPASITNHSAPLTVGSLQVSSTRTMGNLLKFLPSVGPPDNRLVIPKLSINVPLVQPPLESLLKQDWIQVEKDIQGALQQGVVHYPGTAKPGQAGNFFITGHSSYYPWAAGNYKTVFARLGELQPGDEFVVYHGGDRHRYIIQEKKEVSPNNISVLDQPTDERIATLMTCTPVGTTLRRLIVTAKEVDPVSGIALHVGERTAEAPQHRLSLEALPI